MVLCKKILEIAEKYADSSVDGAFAAALATAGPGDADEIALKLLARNDASVAGDALIVHYHLLGEATRAAILEKLGELHSAVRKAAGRGMTHGPLNAMRVIAEGEAYGLSYLVAETLRHGNDPVRKAAGETLYRLVESGLAADWGDEADFPDGKKRGIDHIKDAVIESIQRYDAHHQSLVLRAMAKMGLRVLGPLRGELGNWRSKALAALRDMAAEGQSAEVRQLLLGLMGIKTLAESCEAGIRQSGENGHLDDVIVLGHLLLSGRVVAGMENLGDADHLWPRQEQLRMMDVRRMRNLPRWVMALPGSDGLKLRRLSQLSEVSDEITRLGGLREMMKISRDEAGYYEGIARFCHDGEARIARIALGYLIACQWDGLMELMLRLVNSEHESIRDMAVGYLAPRGFGSLWSNWEGMTQEERLRVGRGLIKMDPGFHRNLGRKLSSGDTRDCMRAMAMIHELNQGMFFEEPLIALACEVDVKVVASAVRALGTGQSAKAVELLETALGHGDSRVRANAVEALEQIEATSHIHRLVQMAAKEDSRPRANAIKALMGMKTDDAMKALKVMLDDGDARQRISALWLVEEMGLLDLTRQVAEMSISDPSRDVTAKAGKVVKGFMAMMGGDVESEQELAGVGQGVG